MKLKQESMRRLISAASLVILFIIFSVTGDKFLTAKNIFNILRESAVTGIIAIGVAFVIITAGIDLSTGAQVGLIAMISANLMYYHELPAGVVILISLLVGVLCGILNGVIVTKLRVPEFIATLSTQYLFRSMVFVFAIREGGVITNKRIGNKAILQLGKSVGNIYYATIAFVILVIVGQFILKKTRFGTYLYATGSNRKSAELSGIPTDKIRMCAFIITGFLCGVGSIFQYARVGSVTTDMGNGLEFDVISAVVIGGCAFSGGRGDIIGVAIGTLFMAVLQNGILKYNFPTATQLIIKGVVIVVMVVFDSVYNKYFARSIQRRAREQEEKE